MRSRLLMACNTSGFRMLLVLQELLVLTAHMPPTHLRRTCFVMDILTPISLDLESWMDTHTNYENHKKETSDYLLTSVPTANLIVVIIFVEGAMNLVRNVVLVLNLIDNVRKILAMVNYQARGITYEARSELV